MEKIIEFEKEIGMDKSEIYYNFSEKVKELKSKLQNKIKELKKDGKIIFGYGAPAKGNVLLNYCNIGTEFLDYIIDTTPLKQGLYTPGMHIPVKSDKEKIEKPSQQIALLLAWNYEQAIINKEELFLKNGGKFLIPIPIPKIISK